MKKYWSLILPLFSLMAISSCKEEPPEEPLPITTEAVIIGCEGLTAAGTATLAEYDPKSEELLNNIFQKANNYILGNILHSMLVEDDKIFLVLSGAGEIVVIDRNNYKVIRRIENLGAPRHIMRITKNKYYITDWQEEGILIYSYTNENIYRTLETGKGPERMALYENLAFVANGGDGNPDSNLTVINTDVDTILAQIKVGYNPNSLQIDRENKLWVLCSGIQNQNPVFSVSGNLVSFDLNKDSLVYQIDSLEILDSLVIVDNQMRPVKMEKNVAGDMLYWLDNKSEANLMKFDVVSMGMPTTFINGSFYGLGVDPIEGDIYLTNAGDNIQNGDVLRFDQNGAQQDFLKVGIKPGCFGFK